MVTKICMINCAIIWMNRGREGKITHELEYGRLTRNDLCVDAFDGPGSTTDEIRKR